MGTNKSIQIEFVSANPTGPLHVGHGRGAAYGDAIGRILSASGYLVEKEYYINDAGRQIDILTASVYIRIYQEIFKDFFPKNAYKGSYIEDIAVDFKKINGITSIEDISLYINNLPEDDEKEIDELIARIKSLDSQWSNIKDFALTYVLGSIKEDLELFNVGFDHWFYESSLGEVADKSSKIALAIDALTLKKLAFKEKGAIWLDTSESGDDKNRVLIREDGRPTYFASDVAYHKDKIDRGFDKLINVWGADHHGYIKRIESSISGLGFDKDKLDVQLVQFANLFKDGKKVKMSTRSGEFYSLRDLIQDIGTDAARFYYLSKQADQHLDFDLNLAKSDSKENMFYYIQYAHARIFSLIKKYKASNTEIPISPDSIIDGSYKQCDKLIHEISRYPSIVKRSSTSLHPHLIIFYLKDLAHIFHSFYNDNPVLTETQDNLNSIILCLGAVKSVIANGLELLGIEPMEKM
jgi:arginyl-tRNA synthetase